MGIGPEGDSTKIPRSALSLGRLNFWKTRVQKQSSVRQFLLRLNNSSGSLLAEDFEICHSALFCLVRFCTETTEAQFEPSFGELEETNRNWINVKNWHLRHRASSYSSGTRTGHKYVCHWYLDVFNLSRFITNIGTLPHRITDSAAWQTPLCSFARCCSMWPSQILATLMKLSAKLFMTALHMCHFQASAVACRLYTPHSDSEC